MKKIIVAILMINSLLIGVTLFNKHNTSTKIEKSNNNPFEINQLLSSEPLQESLGKDEIKTFKIEHFSITPVKKYKIAARLLRKKNYQSGQWHEVLPVDLALGWNIMADMKTYTENNIKVTQSNRFYFLHIDNFEKISRKNIIYNSANVHIMPYNEIIKEKIDELDKNDIIYLEGYLVDILDEKNNYLLRSSLIRQDTGAGACEVFLVTGVKRYE